MHKICNTSHIIGHCAARKAALACLKRVASCSGILLSQCLEISETSRALGTGYDSALPWGVNTWPSLIAIAEELCGGAPPG